MSATEKGYLELFQSPRVATQTREALLSRMFVDDPGYQPRALSGEQLETLRSVLARVVPQDGSDLEIDLAARLDKQLAAATGDGWRYASLPRDAEAYRIGLGLLQEFAMKLSAVPFTRLVLEAQDGLLHAIASSRVRSDKLDLRRWFEDLRADATQIYVSHPLTLARIGYSGIADDLNGFVQIGIGEREVWEPEPLEQVTR